MINILMDNSSNDKKYEMQGSMERGLIKLLPKQCLYYVGLRHNNQFIEHKFHVGQPRTALPTSCC